MDYIFSPWRMKYIENHEREPGCIFCKALQAEDGPQNLVLHRTNRSFVILNLFPYTNAHLMVASQAHIANLEDLGAETRAEMMELIAVSVRAIKAEYHAEAFNIGANIGMVAGAGVVDHVHVHVVPRWAGDVNFMSTISMTRVLPEDLERTYQRLSDRWQQMIS